MTVLHWHRFSKTMMALAIIPFVFAGILAIRTNQFLRHAIPAKAKVIELVSQETKENGTYFAPVFTFTDTNGKIVKVYSRTASCPPTANVGDDIDILYERDTPQSAEERLFMNQWGASIILAGLGTFYFGLFWIVSYFTGRQIKRVNKTLLADESAAPQSNR